MEDIYDSMSKDSESAKSIANLFKGEESRKLRTIIVYPNKKIAEGSNVYEGSHFRDHRAAVKIFTLDQFVALREVFDNMRLARHGKHFLMSLAVEKDEKFAYAAFHRCACSLDQLLEDDWVYSGLLTEDGYPSPRMLELMRRIVAGVKDLHALRIIHGDLNPSHVLIDDKSALRPKLTGMSSSRLLAADESSLGPNATVSGTFGWRSPEQILCLPQTQATDVFSLGCVLFFILTRGKHPFGECDINVANKNMVNLSLVEHIPEATHLLFKLLNPDPELRPKASEVLSHPLFWNSWKRITFLWYASRRVERKDEVASHIVEALEKRAWLAFRGTLDGSLDCASIITENLPPRKQRRQIRSGNVEDLLHIIQVSVENIRLEGLKDVLGSMPEGCYSYFRHRFPYLLMVVYDVIFLHCKNEEWFNWYLKPSRTYIAF